MMIKIKYMLLKVFNLIKVFDESGMFLIYGTVLGVKSKDYILH